jgi:tetratricopeptide (TPR) repeat protein
MMSATARSCTPRWHLFALALIQRPVFMDLQTAYRHHEAGRFADAARVYQALLDRDTENVEALHLFGILHQQCGYSVRAVELIEQAIVLRPDVAAFHANLAEAHRSLKQFDKAADCCRTALRLQPDFPEAANNLGLALHDLGRDEEAVAQFDVALALRPDFAAALNNRGTSLLVLGKADEAMDAYRRAIRLDPKLALARANLGQILIDQGGVAEALSHCQEAVRLNPGSAAGHNNLGNALRALGRIEEARAAYIEAIRLEPGLSVAHNNLGRTLQLEGRVNEAIPHFHRAIELTPDSPDTWEQLAVALSLEGEWAAAIPACIRRVELQPESADAHCALGWAYQSDARPAEAQAEYDLALECNPTHLDAWLNLGSLHEEQGNLAEAEGCYLEAEALHPDSPMPLTRRAMLFRGRLPEADRERLRFHLSKPGHDASSRMNLLFALAQVTDALGNFAEAAACLKPANALALELRRGQGHRYDPDEHSRFVDRLIAAFKPDLFGRLGSAGDNTPQPVFVFGLPRSGTTLVEQVLASHPRVHGAGELSFARRALNALRPSASQPEDLAECLQVLDAKGLRRLAGGYRDAVQALLDRTGCEVVPERVVDKMPDNYLYLGLIALMFPRATLIHIRRDLRDTAVSCWHTYFRSIRWADDPDHLARRFQDHLRLMQHWHQVLPRTIHEVRYERLVDNFEVEARSLFAACGLDWEPGCLQFHQTKRLVRTASVAQVRQPLYRQAIARWKHYESALAELFALLPMPGDESS